ncbi:MAG: PAS domain S-box protein [Deltaproteobacteria bacterium]|nr:PAS domain S-box protein [Deltaproteobacteria bacterium]
MAASPRHRAHAAPPPAPLDLTVFRQMADMSNDGFYLCDATGRLLYVNDRTVTNDGYTRAELLRMTVSDLNPDFPPARFREYTDAMALGTAPPHFETISRRKNGTIAPIELSVARVDVGSEFYLFGVVRDISERKQIEATQRSLTRRILQTLEAERQRVARELHDDVGQALATVGVLLHTLDGTPQAVPPSARPALAATHATIGQITESVARLVRDYHPADLLGLGLEDTVRTRAYEFARRHRLILRLSTNAVAGLLPSEHELHVYRIVQEALANVARHAAARTVTIRLGRERRRVVAVVRDDGIGFTVDPRLTGLGLVTMRERAELMGAELLVRAGPRAGTEVRVSVPISEAATSPRQRGDDSRVRTSAPPASPSAPSASPDTGRATPRAEAPPRPSPDATGALPAQLDLSVFRRMADMSNEAFYVTDHQGRFRYVNQRALDLTGYTWEELQRMTTVDINPDYSIEVYQQAMAELAPGGPLPLVETRTRRKDGSFFPVEVSFALFEASGERYVFGVVRDISARKQMESAQKTFTQRMLQTLEAERQRVARELHDDVGRALATVGGLLRSLEGTPDPIPPDARPALDATLTTIRGITESVARIVRDYHPAELLGRGLEETLRTHAQQFAQRHALTLDLHTAGVAGLLDGERELHLYRIAQEALANVARHARASRVAVSLRRERRDVVLTVRDDGIGLTQGRAATPGLGLVTMRERAELMGARLRVHALPQRGTEVRLTIPIADADVVERRRTSGARRS